MSETCGCGHRVLDHDSAGHCQQWRRYPEVLEARQCGCMALRVGHTVGHSGGPDSDDGHDTYVV